ncbi:hypothetical protein IFR05_013468 [Cadophora sp. M221]|nr:hypothetical protein IFR05_013468 [Cadophora sp. M221]
MQFIFLAVFFAAAFFIATFRHFTSRKSQYRSIPGPKGLPWLGPINQLPFLGLWFKFKDWSDEYGPFYGVKLLGKQHIFICSEKIASELLNKRGSIYSGRPAVPTIVDSQSRFGSAEYMPLMSRNKKESITIQSTNLNPTSEFHTRQKKFNHIALTASLSKNYHSYPSIEAKRFIHHLLHPTSNNWVSLCEDMTSRTISRLTWGSPDPASELKNDAWDLLQAISPVGNLSNLFTPLLLVPTFLSPWKKWEKKRHDRQQEWFRRNLEDVRIRMGEGRADRFFGQYGPSFARTYLEAASISPSTTPFDFNEAASTLGMLSVAAVYTVSSPLQTFIRAAVLHPEWYRRVQEEVDEVCGEERVPEVQDTPRLLVLRAFIKECLRWRPPIPTGVSHELEEDDVYDGYFLPKGTRVHPVEWAFSLDPTIYPSPQTFNPDRYLSPSYPTYREPLKSYPSILKNTTFGWGRRICQGAALTEQELITACGGLAWTFDLRCKEGEEGEVEAEMKPPGRRGESLVIVKPRGFGLVCEVRGEGVEKKRRREVVERLYRESWEGDVLRGVGSVNVE